MREAEATTAATVPASRKSCMPIVQSATPRSARRSLVSAATPARKLATRWWLRKRVDATATSATTAADRRAGRRARSEGRASRWRRPRAPRGQRSRCGERGVRPGRRPHPVGCVDRPRAERDLDRVAELRRGERVDHRADPEPRRGLFRAEPCAGRGSADRHAPTVQTNAPRKARNEAASQGGSHR